MHRWNISAGSVVGGWGEYTEYIELEWSGMEAEGVHCATEIRYEVRDPILRGQEDRINRNRAPPCHCLASLWHRWNVEIFIN